MTIASYTDLVTACQNWLFGRTDIAARVPEFIVLFEAKANRNLLCRQMESRVVATIDTTTTEPEFLALPTDFQTMRRVRLINTFDPGDTIEGVINKPRLKFATGAQIDDLRQRNLPVAAPIWFTIFGNDIELCPTPDQDYQVEMVYRANIPPLTSSNPTNWLIALAPDAYLYGTLMEAAPYLRDDDRISVWSAGVQAAFTDLNTMSEEAIFNAGPLVHRRKGRGYS